MRARLLFLLLPAACASYGFTTGWELRSRVSPGQVVEIRGINGDVHAVPAPDGQFAVSAKLVGDGSETRNIQVNLVADARGLIVCPVYAGETTCRAAGDRTAPAARVDYLVHVPPGVNLLARTVNGGVEAESLNSDVQAYTINGGIRVSTSGTLTARAVNGSIEASFLNPLWSRPSELATVNGGIFLSLPNSSRASVSAETRNGSIVSDLPSLKGSVTEHRIEGRLGGGGGSPLVLRTINGKIHLKRAH